MKKTLKQLKSFSVKHRTQGRSRAVDHDALPEKITELDKSVNQGQYIYKPLDQGRREIRLVELSSECQVASNGDRVPLLLMHYAFFDEEVLPQYSALSYTWGTGPKAIVLVEDEKIPAREVLISTNLLDALYHFARLLHPKQGALFWIDQLCINQNDNNEKSHQVRMMTDIFGRARTTNVWLGSIGATFSDEGIQKYNRRYQYAVDGYVNIKMLESELDSNDSVISQRLDRILSEMCRNYYEELYSLRYFCLDPWFERAWVIQEVVLATISKVIVQWEGGGCTWREVVQIYVLSEWLRLRSTIANGSYPAVVTYMLQKANERLKMTAIQSVDLPRTKPLITLINDLLTSGQTRATQPEDLVYSLMGLGSDGDTCGIEIDYDKHYTEVFREVALLLLKTLGAQTLAWSGQLKRDSNIDGCRLPSWVPDLRLQAPNIIFFHFNVPLPKLFSAAGNRTFEYTVGRKSKVLSVRTTYVGRVIEAGRSFEGRASIPDPTCNVLTREQARLTHFGRFLDVAAVRHPSRYDYSTRQEMRWRMPIADRYLDGDSLRRAGPEVKDWYIAFTRPDDPSSGSAVSHSWGLTGRSYLDTQVPFVTETGYIGIGHKDIVEGDEVHFIQGSETPFILRKIDSGYKLVGETYVHGIMDGELVDDNTEFEWVQIH